MKEAIVLRPADPTPLGSLVKAKDLSNYLLSEIDTKVPFEPDLGSYPEYFKEFTRLHLERYSNHGLLVLPGGTKIDGDLDLDFSAHWLAPNRLAGIVCEGDLNIGGDLYNRNFSSGALLFVSGDLRVDNVFKSGAPVMVLGSVRANGIVLAEYNDGVMRIAGDLDAQAYFLFDHDGYVRGTIRSRSFSSDEDIWRAVLVNEAFENERDDYPDTTLLWQLARQGLPFMSGM